MMSVNFCFVCFVFVYKVLIASLSGYLSQLVIFFKLVGSGVLVGLCIFVLLFDFNWFKCKLF